MRIGTVLGWGVGIAMGAAGARLLDPDAGRERRREAARAAVRRGSEVDWVGLARSAGGAAAGYAERAAAGYREGLEEQR